MKPTLHGEDAGTHVPLRILAAITALASAGALAAPPNPGTRHSLVEKYSDQGAKPAHGRAGNAQLSARALVGMDGNARIDVNTADFDGGAATGTLQKVQVKLFNGGKLLATDNYNNLGGTTAGFDYPNLLRGSHVVLQANVKSGRAEVVSLETTVMRRPDLAPLDLVVPDNAAAFATLPVTAYVSEKNGDVGARFTCQLFIDDVPAGEIPGAWVDAGSSVACRFMPNFGSPGEKRVSVRVAGVTPSDYDTSNNALETTVNVTPQPFDSADGRYYWHTGAGGTKYWTWWASFGQRSDWFSDVQEFSEFSQSYGAEATVKGRYPVEGTLTLRHSMDGVALAPIEIDVGSLDSWEDTFPGCRIGVLDTGVYAFACSYAPDPPSEFDQLNVGAFVESGRPVYSPGWWWGMAEPIANGDTYRVEIEFEGPAVARRSAIEVPIPAETVITTNGWLPWSCQYYIDYWTASADCRDDWYEHHYRDAIVYQPN